MDKKIKKGIDFYMAMEIFLLAIIEFVSWRHCVTEEYFGPVCGSNYLLKWFAVYCVLGFLVVGLGKVFKSYRFKVCIYTKIVSWMFLTIQLLNLSALIFEYGIDFYSLYAYPIFLCTIILLIMTKLIKKQWGS